MTHRRLNKSLEKTNLFIDFRSLIKEKREKEKTKEDKREQENEEEQIEERERQTAHWYNGIVLGHEQILVFAAFRFFLSFSFFYSSNEMQVTFVMSSQVYKLRESKSPCCKYWAD
jgi:hypothetical protein